MITMKCPYVNNYECDDCRYCKIEPHKKSGLDNWNMLEKTQVVEVSLKGEEIIEGKDFVDKFDREFLGNDENGILSDERMFENNLDGGLMQLLNL